MVKRQEAEGNDKAEKEKEKAAVGSLFTCGSSSSVLFFLSLGRLAAANGTRSDSYCNAPSELACRSFDSGGNT